MTSITMSYDVAERAEGWFFRYPAGDESATWSGPYPTQDAAQEAAAKECEAHLAKAVSAALGIA